ncbi:hypothetical protein DBIPINDM_008061 (plasmid) [Mesorhizobium sp. AR02]|uniref:hypothetical protein n=1 Tax=Mesorhizobium sp. AR02 TaxID=2865837 RepID=UPI0021FC2C2D|nr:hypothetical protein DBIPINDM_008061 [Mesorhizobium sp. AR02]
MIKELKPYLIGWRDYFGFCQTPHGCLRTWKRGSAEDYACISGGNGEWAQPLQGTAPSWRTKVRSCDCRRFTDGILAHVFESLGLPRLHVFAQA